MKNQFKSIEGFNENKGLQNDNIFVTSEVQNLSNLTGLPVRKGLEQAVVSEGQIVNIVSNNYGHLPNERFFAEVERKLINCDINYITRSINRDNRSFAVDYILNDPALIVTVKNGADEITPMLRFTNSYDGSCKTSGHFGFFRKVCANGLHVATSTIGFSIKHRGQVQEIVMPEINQLVKKFYDNEYYSLRHKFEVLAERPISDISEFVKTTAKDLDLFKFESSEKNPAPSLNARIVIETIERETSLLGERANLWIGYNAFNELIHNKLKKTFEQQKKLDIKLLEYVGELN